MIPADLARYGGQKSNAGPIKDPTVQMDADDDNRRSCDLAQLTRTGAKLWFRFETRLSNGTVSVVARSTYWGDTNSFDPTTAERTAAGVYEFTWPSSFNDELLEAETVSFTRGKSNINSSTDFGFHNVRASGAGCAVYIADTSGTPDDLTAGTQIDVWLY